MLVTMLSYGHKMHSLPETMVLADEDLFAGVSGRGVGMRAPLYAKAGCKPNFLKARPVAFALKLWRNEVFIIEICFDSDPHKFCCAHAEAICSKLSELAIVNNRS